MVSKTVSLPSSCSAFHAFSAASVDINAADSCKAHARE